MFGLKVQAGVTGGCPTCAELTMSSRPTERQRGSPFDSVCSLRAGSEISQGPERSEPGTPCESLKILQTPDAEGLRDPLVSLGRDDGFSTEASPFDHRHRALESPATFLYYVTPLGG